LETIDKILKEVYKLINPLILIGLINKKGAIYKKFLNIIKQWVEKTTKDNILRTLHVFIIIDLIKDYNNLIVIITLKELYCLNIVILKGFIANLIPINKRKLFK
jgi:hypothetical protein